MHVCAGQVCNYYRFVANNIFYVCLQFAITNHSCQSNFEITNTIVAERLLVAEASCTSAIRTARDTVKDIGQDAAKKVGGLLELAKVKEQNSERDTHRVFVRQCGLGLPIPKTKMETSGPWSPPILRLRDWIGFLLQINAWHLVTGLVRPDSQREFLILEAFWSKYKRQDPLHPIFEMAERKELVLGRTAPFVLHGDEGRGRRRQQFLVLSFHSLLGRGLAPAERSKKKSGTKKAYLKMKPNFKGSTLTNRFLYAALAKRDYNNDRSYVFDDLIRCVADESKFLSSVGVKHPQTGDTYWVMQLGIVGDWPWLVKSGNLSRNFACVQKHAVTRNPCRGICHLCNAGRPGCAFESLGTRRPTWLATMYQDSPFDAPTPFQQIPHPRNCLAGLWKFDVFHVWHLGLGKTFLSSYIALLSEVQSASSIDSRFIQLSAEYKLWCRSNSRTMYVQKISKELICWITTSDFPNGQWHKGALTRTLMDFVESRFGSEDFSNNELLSRCQEACTAANSMLRLLYNNDLWLTVDVAREAGELGMKFLRRFECLARRSHELGKRMFILQPKCHAFHHLCLDLLHGSQRNEDTLNILAFSCQADEDYIGRPSRISRRVTSGDTTSDRVIDRLLQASHGEWVKAGLVVVEKPASAEWNFSCVISGHFEFVFLYI